VNYMRKSAITAGVLFIVATVAGVASVVALGSNLEGADFLAKVAAHPDNVTVAAVLEAVMALACAGIAIAIYPVLRRTNPGLAIGAVGFRMAEAVVFLVSSVAMLSLVTLGQDQAVVGTQSSANLLRVVVDQFAVVSVLPFGAGAMLYYYGFWQSRILPRWLSGWGLAAMGVMLAVAVGAILTRTDYAGYSALLMPLALQEMVLAVWLIAKGYRAPVEADATAPAPGAALGVAAA
jgi:hypothetical protein